MMIRYLNEAKRSELLNKSKKSLKGKQRYDRRRKSTIANTVREYNKIDMNKLFKEGILTLDVKVRGETDNYLVKISFGGLLDILQDQVKSNNNKLELKCIIKALSIAFNRDDVYVHCQCPDFCLEENTMIKLLNGETYTIKEIYEQFKENKELWVYSTDENGDFKPGKVTDVWISGYQKEMVKVILDNDKEIITTPNHRYMLRDGTYCEAKNLSKDMSLMPLYFSYHNGYESVKKNSVTDKTIFESVYKLTSSAVLQKEIEDAKIRSNEQIIQIHHKDFNKLNNYPSNLYPMGKLEHRAYHYNHLVESGALEKFLEGGRKYWAKQSSRDAQSKVAREVLLKYYSTHSKEEISAIRRQSGAYNDEWKHKISESNKKVWENYTEEQYSHRCEINKESNKKGKEKQSKKRIDWWERNPDKKIIALNNLKKAQDAVRGVPKKESTKKLMSLAVLNETPEKRYMHHLNIRNSKIKHNLDYMMSNNIEITFENYNKIKRTGDPKLSTYFNSVEEVYDYYNLNNNYNHKIKSVEFITFDQEIPVYDISVEKYNNFYVDAGVVLHSCYRFQYWSTVNKYNSGDPQYSNGKKIRNPNDTLGSSCKHILLVLSNTQFLIKVASVINNYIKYMSEHYERLYADIIYPRIYGKKYEDAVQLNMFDDSDELVSDEETIDASNIQGKERTQFKKGNTQGIRFTPNTNDEDQIKLNFDNEEQ